MHAATPQVRFPDRRWSTDPDGVPIGPTADDPRRDQWPQQQWEAALGASSHRLSLRYRVSINLSLPLSTAAQTGQWGHQPRTIRLTADDVDAAPASQGPDRREGAAPTTTRLSSPARPAGHRRRRREARRPSRPRRRNGRPRARRRSPTCPRPRQRRCGPAAGRSHRTPGRS